jgi:hypothetical protein
MGGATMEYWMGATVPPTPKADEVGEKVRVGVRVSIWGGGGGRVANSEREISDQRQDVRLKDRKPLKTDKRLGERLKNREA